jgi:hypothetical protein
MSTPHPPIDRRQKQISLRGKVPVDRPLAHAQRVSQELGIRLGETPFGEQACSRIENLFFPSLAKLRIGGSAGAAVRKRVGHGAHDGRTSQSFNYSPDIPSHKRQP